MAAQHRRTRLARRRRLAGAFDAVPMLPESRPFPRARQRGDFRVALAITLLLLAGGVALTWAWWQRTRADNGASEPVATGPIVRADVPPPAPRSIEQLLGEVRAAVAAPAPSVSTTAPVLQRRVEPYPQEVRRSRREGWVEVAFTGQPDGHVGAVKVLQSKPGSVFDLAATRAVQRWVFAPATRNGRPVAASLRQRLDFRL